MKTLSDEGFIADLAYELQQAAVVNYDESPEDGPDLPPAYEVIAGFDWEEFAKSLLSKFDIRWAR